MLIIYFYVIMNMNYSTIQEGVLMKKCLHCSFENQDNACFCAKCGNKLSEKKVCPHCHNEIDNLEAIYCLKCGKKLNESEKAETVIHPSYANEKRRKLDLVSMSLLFGVVLLSLLFIMLPIFTIKIPLSDGITMNESKSIFYFFYDFLNEGKILLEGSMLTSHYTGLVLSILVFIAIIGISIYAITMFILSFLAKRKFNLMLCAIASLSIFIGFFVYIRNFPFSEHNGDNYAGFSLSIYSIIYLVMSFILIISSFVIQLMMKIQDNELNKKQIITKSITSGVALIFFIVGCAFLISPYSIIDINVMVESSSDDVYKELVTETIKANALPTLAYGYALDNVGIAMTLHILGAFLSIALMFVLFTILYQLFSFKKESKGLNWSVAIPTIVLSIAMCILAIFSCETTSDGLAYLCEILKKEFELFYRIGVGAILPFVCFIITGILLFVSPLIPFEKKDNAFN